LTTQRTTPPRAAPPTPKPAAKRGARRAAPKPKTTAKQVERQLEAIERMQLVRKSDEPDLAYLFKHTLTQECAYQSLLVKQRRVIHRRVAEAYEKLHAEDLEEYVALLARHYAEAGDDAKTLEYATRAGDAAIRVYATAEAIEHYSRALVSAPRVNAATAQWIHLFRQRGRAWELQSRFDLAEQNYKEMLELARARGDQALELAALTARSTIQAIPGSMQNPTQAQIFSDDALHLARALGDRAAEAKILWNLELLNIYGTGDSQKAIEYGEQAAALARELNLREQLAFALHDLFLAYIYSGEIERALATRSEAADLWRELHNLPMLAENLGGPAILDFLQGDVERATTLAREAYQIGESISNLGAMGFSSHVLGYIFLERGEFGAAIDVLHAAVRDTEVGGVGGAGLNAFGELAWIFANAGDFARALAFARAGIEHTKTQIPLHRSWPYAVWTRIWLATGDLTQAEACFRQVQVESPEESFGKMFPLGAPTISLAAAELALAHRDYAQAIEYADDLRRGLAHYRARLFIPDLLLVKAHAQRAQGNIAEAQQNLEEARSLAEAIGSRRTLWQIYRALAKSADAEAAARWREHARAVIAYLAAHMGDDDLRNAFLNRAEVRELNLADDGKR
jgi:tetratricopeptide (TPR) repeat protein